jgi:hypothetical protein
MAINPVHRQSVAERLRLVARIIRSGSTEVCIRKWVGKILGGRPARGTKQELEAIFKWVQSNITPTPDPRGFDAFFNPCVTLEAKVGDCDDQTIVIGSILMHIGYPFKLRAVSYDGRVFSHIYGLAGTDMPSNGPSWVSMDTVFGTGPGMTPKAKLKMEVIV